jgi:hypothetical protein
MQVSKFGDLFQKGIKSIVVDMRGFGLMRAYNI